MGDYEKSTFSIYVREKRVESGISLRQMAEYLGISSVELGEIERGVQKTLPRSLWKKFLKVVDSASFEELVSLEKQSKGTEKTEIGSRILLNALRAKMFGLGLNTVRLWENSDDALDAILNTQRNVFKIRYKDYFAQMKTRTLNPLYFWHGPKDGSPPQWRLRTWCLDVKRTGDFTIAEIESVEIDLPFQRDFVCFLKEPKGKID